MRGEPRVLPGRFRGLSIRLIALIVFVILAIEIIVYVPSIANYRASWLDDRLRIGVVAARVLDAVPDVMSLPRELTDRLLTSAGADAIVYRRAGQSQLIEFEEPRVPVEVVTADMRVRDPVSLISGAFETLFMGGDRTLRIIGAGDLAGSDVEMVMPEAPLRRDMLTYSRNIFLISLGIASITALVFYVFISSMLIAPIRRLTQNMISYRQAPENATLIIDPSRRRDEIGIVERELASMESDVFTMLRQRRHLADLGLAVAKINHDLRNTLTSAQLLSDQVATLDDPKVQRLAPKLVSTLDKAIRFAQAVLDHGNHIAAPPRPMPVDLRGLIDDAAFSAGLVAHPEIVFTNGTPDNIVLALDSDQMSRVFVNLLKNAREALEASSGKIANLAVTVAVAQTPDQIMVSVQDNGPGLPPRARDNLFVAFEGSARAGGTGLGLAIARELTVAHGGDLKFVDQPTGTRFEVTLPAAAALPEHGPTRLRSAVTAFSSDESEADKGRQRETNTQ